MLFRLSIKHKLIIGLVVITVLFFVITIAANVVISRKIIINFASLSIKKEVTAQSLRASSFLTQAISDVKILAKARSIRGIISAKDNGGIDPVEQITYDEWRRRLADTFAIFAQEKKMFFQIRYIDETGDEVVRIDYNNNEVKVASDDKLQNKSNRYYFREAMLVEPGSIYVSRVDLNKEGNPPKIEKPYKPNVRYAAPIIDNQGRRRGIVIVNLAVLPLFNKIKLSPEFSQGDVFIIDQDGYYLFNLDPAKRWGSSFDLGHQANIKNDFPEIAQNFFDKASGSLVLDKNIISFARIQLSPQDPSRYMVLIRKLPISEVMADMNQQNQKIIILALILLFLFIVSYYVLVDYLVSPLNQLVSAALSLGQGDFSKRVKINSHDEIGNIAVAFNNMADQLQKSHEELEKKVRERTIQLENAKKVTEKKLSETERLNKILVARELKMRELKKEIEALKKKIEKKNKK